MTQNGGILMTFMRLVKLFIHLLIFLDALYAGQGGDGSGAYPGLEIHLGWDAGPSQGTMHKHTLANSFVLSITISTQFC